MANVTGALTVSAGGQEYRLWLGMSVIADLQAKYGNDVFAQIEQPKDAPDSWMPPLGIMVNFIIGGLQRYHPGLANRWTADDILAENAAILPEMMAAAFPDQSAEGNDPPKKAKRG